MDDDKISCNAVQKCSSEVSNTHLNAHNKLAIKPLLSGEAVVTSFFNGFYLKQRIIARHIVPNFWF